MNNNKIPSKLENVFIVSKNELVSLCDLRPVWLHLKKDNIKSTPNFSVDQLYNVSDAVLKITAKNTDKQKNYKELYELSIEVLKNSSNEVLVGHNIIDKEKVIVENINHYTVRLPNMTHKNYNRIELSPFIRRYCFIPSYSGFDISNSHNYYELNYIFSPIRKFVKDPKTGNNTFTYIDNINYVFLVEFNQPIRTKINNYKSIINCINTLPIKN